MEPEIAAAEQTVGHVALPLGGELPPVPAGWSSFENEWLKLHYPPDLAAQMRELQEAAPQARAQLSELLGRPVLSRVEVRVARTPREMEQLAPTGSRFPKYASGLAYSERRLVLLTAEPRYPGERHRLVEVFRHELAHVALHDALGRENVPLWFNEGFAVHASGEAEMARLQTLWTATLAKTLLPLQDLSHRFPADATTASIAYAQAADFVRFLLKNGQEHRFRSLLERVAEGQEFEQALADAYATDLWTLESEWRADAARRYTFWPFLFGSSTIWAFALGLVVWGYVRRKRRAQIKLERWAVEEAEEDAELVALARQREEEAQRLQLLLRYAREQNAPYVLVTQQPSTPSDLPSIEHEGGRHTLH